MCAAFSLKCCKEDITCTYALIISTLLFHVLCTSILIWRVWSVIVFAWLMSQKVGCQITAVQFCKWLTGVWKAEWETFKEVYYVRAKENDINSTSGMKLRQREESLFEKFIERALCIVEATLDLTSSDFIQDLSLIKKIP